VVADVMTRMTRGCHDANDMMVRSCCVAGRRCGTGRDAMRCDTRPAVGGGSTTGRVRRGWRWE
jgi:hypothetical protein